MLVRRLLRSVQQHACVTSAARVCFMRFIPAPNTMSRIQCAVSKRIGLGRARALRAPVSINNCVLHAHIHDRFIFFVCVCVKCWACPCAPSICRRPFQTAIHHLTHTHMRPKNPEGNRKCREDHRSQHGGVVGREI